MSDDSSPDDPFAVGKEGLDAEAESFDSGSTEQSPPGTEKQPDKTEADKQDTKTEGEPTDPTERTNDKSTEQAESHSTASNDDRRSESAIDDSPAIVQQESGPQGNDSGEASSSSHPLGEVAPPDELRRTSLPPKLYRDSPKENRKQVAIDLTQEEVDRINELYSIAEDEFADEKVFKSDVKKAAFRSDLSHNDFLGEMRQIGYGYMGDISSS